jgi:hypothetical protein
MSIRVLDPVVAQQVAAGEVVDRPASVVKELVENSLDAGAARVEVELGDGGTSHILVRDEGSGMSPEDAGRAVGRHATSKIVTADDLARVDTLGFRGEALHAIGAVSSLTLTTCDRGAGLGARVGVFAGEVVDENFAPGGREVGTVDGTLYAVWFRAAQKSTVWYNTHVFEDAGVQPPTTWDELQQTAQTISDFGVPPYSIGVDVGWPLSDLFENIYLRTAGPEKYDQLARHEIPWTDPSVIEALTTMGEIIGDDSLIAGGTSGALQTDFTGSVTQMFADPPEGAILFEGNFVGAIVNGETKARVGTDADFFDFPSIDGSEPAVMGGGDLAALFKDTEGGRELLKFLATPEAAEVWAGIGGFISPNKNVDSSAYADPIDQRAAQALVDAGDAVRYDLSDLQPTEFGATTGEGIWGILTDFMSNPDDVEGTAQQLEAAAKAAYGK